MATKRSKARASKEPKARKARRGPPELCGCPTGARMRLRDGESVCETADQRRVSMTCSTRARSYRIGAPNTKTDGNKGKARGKGIVIDGPGLDYDTASQPCGTKRAGCPVQLVFRGGKPHLRFCIAAGNGEPGHFVAVDSPTRAREIATQACEQWRADGGTFTESNPAVVAAGGALGRVRRRRR